MTILQFPTRPEQSPRPTGPRATQSLSRSNQLSPDRYFPRRFHPLRERAPFLIHTVLSVLGTVLVLGAAVAVLEIYRSAPRPAAEPVEEAAAD